MSRVVDDALHSQLSKGRPPGQTQIDALDRGVGQTAFGQCEVQEIQAQTALTDFTMGGRSKGVAWSLNPYVGCLHACRYCFVPQTLHVERARWGRYVLVKANLPRLLRSELEEKSKLSTFVSTATDPYQPIEKEKRITRSCLGLLARKDWPVDILTRSPLVTRDIDVLSRFRRLRVGISIPTLDEEARRFMEPHAPSVQARLDAMRKLADAGLKVYANYAPAYPITGGHTAAGVATVIKAAGARWVNTSPWRYQAGYLARLWDDTRATRWSELTRFVGNKIRHKNLLKELGRAFKEVGLPLRNGFFNAPFEEEKTAVVHGSLDAADSPASDVVTPLTIGTRPCS